MRLKGIAPKLFFTLLVPLFLLVACERKAPEVHVLKGRRVIVLMPPDTTVRAPLPSDTSYLEHVFAGYDLVDIGTMDSSILVSLKYADTSNFVHTNLYDGLNKAYMTCDLAIRLCNARHHLRLHDSTLTLLLLDAARPLHLQQIMWDSLDMLPALKKSYLTPPELTSLHNYGCAVDVTLARTADSLALPMGSAFDQFDSLSQPRFEAIFSRLGRISGEELANRRLLRHVMVYAGLREIQTEWWHFGLCTKVKAAATYSLIR